MERGEPLGLYHEKRDFSRTPEPRGKAHPAGAHGLYVIQKHAASHLHYDFRLELGGVLKSWAVPKGPSYDPQQKRLAQHVEDHPVEYGEFEGLIPKGEYGGGTVLLWDRGHWEPVGDAEEGYRKGKLKFHLFGDKLKGGFTLVRMHGDRNEDGKSWLLIKERDDTAKEGDIVAERPESVATGRTIEEIAADPEASEWHSNRAETKGAAEKEKKSAGAHKKPGAVTKAAAEKTVAVEKPAKLEGAHKAAMPETVELQLATLVSKPPAGEQWLYEMKLDGYRLLAFAKKGTTQLITRGEQDWTHRFPTVAEAVAALPMTQAILDGELTVLRPDGVSDFQALQNAMRDGKEASLVYFAFDLLYLDGYDLRGVALEARKRALQSLLAGLPAGSPVRYSDHLASEGDVLLEKACELGVEGVIAKERDAPYRAGRGGSWLKIKCHHRQELVVGGFTEPSGSRLGLGALLVGYHDAKGELIYAGKVGTGLSGKVLQEMRTRLEALEQKESPFATRPRMPRAHWTKPVTVVEVRFAGWTEGNRVRQGAFMGLREDRDAKTVVRETARKPPVEKAHPEAKPAKKAHPEAKSAKKAADSMTGPTAVKSPAVKSPAAKSPAAKSHDTKKSPVDPAVAQVKLTHPDKVLYPAQGITKQMLADYYVAVAPHMLPLVAKRPLTLVRCPNGQGKPGFFQKHEMKGMSAEIGRVPIEEEGGEHISLYVESAAALVALVQLGALELHTWGSHIDTLEKPDHLVFDLDPGPGVKWPTVVEAAQAVRTLLDALGLQSFVKTTGGKGLHVALPLQPTFDWEELRPFAKAVATMLEKAAPERYVASMSKALRPGKVFIDYFRNTRGATSVAPYSTRARADALVAMPLTWEELEKDKVEPSAFTIQSVPEWLDRRGDAWAKLPAVKQKLTEAMMKRLGV